MKVKIIAIILLLARASFAAPDYSFLNDHLSKGVQAVSHAVSIALVYGFNIFLLLWGYRAIKRALAGEEELVFTSNFGAPDFAQVELDVQKQYAEMREGQKRSILNGIKKEMLQDIADADLTPEERKHQKADIEYQFTHMSDSEREQFLAIDCKRHIDYLYNLQASAFEKDHQLIEPDSPAETEVEDSYPEPDRYDPDGNLIDEYDDEEWDRLQCLAMLDDYDDSEGFELETEEFPETEIALDAMEILAEECPIEERIY